MTDREDRSHIRSDGRAKVSYATYELAAIWANQVWGRTGIVHGVYRCAQNPEHYHVGRGVSDLKGNS